MAVTLSDRDRAVPGNPRQREGVASVLSQPGEGRVAQAVRLESPPPTLDDQGVSLEVFRGEPGSGLHQFQPIALRPCLGPFFVDSGCRGQLF